MARGRGDRGPTRTPALRKVAKQVGIDLDDPEWSAELKEPALEEPGPLKSRESWLGHAFLHYRRLLEGVESRELCGGRVPKEIAEAKTLRRRTLDPIRVADWAYRHRHGRKTFEKLAESEKTLFYEELRRVRRLHERGEVSDRDLLRYEKARPPNSEAVRRAVARHAGIWKLAEAMRHGRIWEELAEVVALAAAKRLRRRLERRETPR